jgi:hypothetical protein
MMIAGNVCMASFWLFRRRKLLLGLLRYKVGHYGIHWGTEVWHFQWRIAVSWLCGYFIFQLYNPVLFAYKGAVIAGQMGMSLTLCAALQSISISWINTKAPRFGAFCLHRGRTRSLVRGSLFELGPLSFGTPDSRSTPVGYPPFEYHVE